MAAALIIISLTLLFVSLYYLFRDITKSSDQHLKSPTAQSYARFLRWQRLAWWLGLLLILIGLLWPTAPGEVSAGYLLVFGGLTIVVIASWVKRQRRQDYQAQQLDDSIRTFVQPHLKTLALKYFIGHRQDDYGNTIDCGWAKELSYYYEKVLRPQFPTITPEIAQTILSQEMNAIPKSTLDAYTKLSSNDIKTGTDFERFTKSELENNGWAVHHTGKTGDQGADLIATKDGRSFVIQCKYSSSAVSNKAIQEAFAAQGFYAADRAAVVSNAPFTRSANTLARSLKVLLLHPAQLDELEHHLG